MHVYCVNTKLFYFLNFLEDYLDYYSNWHILSSTSHRYVFMAQMKFVLHRINNSRIYCNRITQFYTFYLSYSQFRIHKYSFSMEITPLPYILFDQVFFELFLFRSTRHLCSLQVKFSHFPDCGWVVMYSVNSGMARRDYAYPGSRPIHESRQCVKIQTNHWC